MESSEPFYKWYYRHQNLRGKIRLRWNWLKTDIRIFTAITKSKLKYGWSYNENEAINEKE